MTKDLQYLKPGYLVRTKAWCEVMKQMIKSGFVIDGTGREGFKADVLVNGDLITEIGQLEAPPDCEIIDAHGKIVCPGFIDTHSHSDLNLFNNPTLLPKISQGITTEILGQDGLSAAPVTERYLQVWQKNVSGLLGDLGEQWWWKNVNDYLKAIEHIIPATNIQYLAPHGNIRMLAMGLEAGAASETQIREMEIILEECLEDGCCGLSTGIIYPPCTYAAKEELLALCKVLARYNKPFVIHQRSEADDIISSTEEVLELGYLTGVKIHFSHMKLAGKKNWNLLDRLMEILSKARDKGLDISFDQYPYTAGSTMLSVILPPWVHSGGSEKIIERLKNSSLRTKIKEDILHGIPGWDNFVDFAGCDGIYITDTKYNKDVIGLNLSQLGEKNNCDPLDATFDLLIEEQTQVSMVDFYGNEESLITFMKDERQNFCTDGLLGGQPHPRVYGSFSRVLGRYVREQKILSLEEAVKKMTFVPAERFSIDKRGLIKQGCYADIVIFDKDTVSDKGTYTDPCQFSEGIARVFINGKTVYGGGKATGIRSGRILKG